MIDTVPARSISSYPSKTENHMTYLHYFYVCIGTERVRKLSIFSFYVEKCRFLVLIRSNRLSVLCYTLYFPTQTRARGCVE